MAVVGSSLNCCHGETRNGERKGMNSDSISLLGLRSLFLPRGNFDKKLCHVSGT